MTFWFPLCVWAPCATVPRLPESALLRLVNVLEACRSDIPAMEPVAEEAADRLARGGRFWAAGNRSLVSELTGRAGGFMMLKPLGEQCSKKGDVVLYFPCAESSPPAGKGLLVCFGESLGRDDCVCFPNHADAAGSSVTLGQTGCGWVFSAEVISALTRKGMMPVMYETIGAYGGNGRIVLYKNGEIPFHTDITVQPVPSGHISEGYIHTICAMLARVEREEYEKLKTLGRWAREAHSEGKTLYMYSMGHLFPDEVEASEIGSAFTSGVWNAGFRHPTPAHEFLEGDLVVHIGYQHPPQDLLRKARDARARVGYVSLYPDRDYTQDPGVIWIDPMWPWSDACVPIEGYDVSVLPASGLVNGAIAWEIYRLATE